MEKLINYNKGAMTFSVKNETDAKLVSLAIRLMADIERKGNAAREHLNRKPFWIRDESRGLWWSLNDTHGEFFWGISDADDPYNMDSLTGKDGSFSGFYTVLSFGTYQDALSQFGLQRYASYIQRMQDKMFSEMGIPASRMGYEIYVPTIDRYPRP